MTLDEAVTYLREALDKVDPTVHTEFRMSPQEVEQFLYWLTEYKGMTSGRQSENLSERLASHLVWAESNSYECPVTLAEDLQEAISTLAKAKRQMQISNEMIVERDCVIDGMENEINRLQSESSWISCEEKPPERIIYLVTDGYCAYFGYYDVFENHWTTEEDTDGNSLLYWMPIPKPPKEE